MPASFGAALGALDEWVDGPASLIGERWSAMRPGDRVVIRIAEDAQSFSLASEGRTAPAPVRVSLDETQLAASRAAIAPMLLERNVTVLVSAAWIIERRVDLPLEAASHVEGIVASRVNTLSPVPLQDTLFGHRVLGVDRTAKKLSVVIVILPKARIARMLEFLEGIKWREISVEAPFGDDGLITLYPRRSGVVSARRRVKTAMAAVLGASFLAVVVTLGIGPLVDGRFAGKRDDLTRRADVARAIIAKSATPEQAATVPEQAALDLKNDAVSAIGALDDLAAALPTHSYATEIALADGRIRLSGRTTDLPDVLTSLESSGRFLDSKLVGTALRDDDGTASDFELETRPLIRTGGALK